MMGELRGWCLISLKVGFLAKVKVTQGGSWGAFVEKPPRERWVSSKAGETEAEQVARVPGNQPGHELQSQSPQGRHPAAPQTQASHRPACHAGKCTGGMFRDAEQEPWFILLWGECARQSEEGELPASPGL